MGFTVGLQTVWLRRFCHNTGFPEGIRKNISELSYKPTLSGDLYILLENIEISSFHLPFISHNVTKTKASNNCKSTNLIKRCTVFILYKNIIDCEDMYT